MTSFKRTTFVLSVILSIFFIAACSSNKSSESASASASSGSTSATVGAETNSASASASTSSAQKQEVPEEPEDTVPRSFAAELTGGKAFWVLPGPRKLSPTVFGTKENPKRLVKPKIKKAKGTVPKLLKKLPLLVGLPMSGPWGRHSTNGGQVLKHGSPFGNKMKPVKGDHQFSATFEDNQLDDSGKRIIDTDDSVTFQARFNDPQGNSYVVKAKKAFKPPIPGWKTEGGVLMNSYIGGTTGTFIPLLPKSYSLATFWAIGQVKVNDKDPVPRVVVFYITEDVRDSKGRLALDEQMPLDPDGVQAHLLVPPIKPVLGKGPVPAPVPTAFELPPKAPKDVQPFISIYYPNPDITEGQEYVR